MGDQTSSVPHTTEVKAGTRVQALGAESTPDYGPGASACATTTTFSQSQRFGSSVRRSPGLRPGFLSLICHDHVLAVPDEVVCRWASTCLVVGVTRVRPADAPVDPVVPQNSIDRSDRVVARSTLDDGAAVVVHDRVVAEVALQVVV